jgi:hypothetical protein
LDIRVFQKKDGGIVQLIDKEKMEEWPVELPLIFIEYVKNNQLKSYDDNKLKKEVENYLNEVLNDVAIPRLIDVLESDKEDEILDALIRLEELSKKNIDQMEPIKPYLKKLATLKNEKVQSLLTKISERFSSEEKKKELDTKRKLMQQKEKDFLAGKISGEEYAKIRKEYLLLRG